MGEIGDEDLTVAMRQEVSLELRLLRERLIRSMAAFPAAIVSVAFRAINSIHVSRNKMILQSTRVCERDSTRCFDAIYIDNPFASMEFAVFGRKIRCRQNRGNATIQWWWGFSRAWDEV